MRAIYGAICKHAKNNFRKKILNATTTVKLFSNKKINILWFFYVF